MGSAQADGITTNEGTETAEPKRRAGGRRRGAKVLSRADRPLRWAEALELPGTLIADLPCPPALSLRVGGLSCLVRLDSAIGSTRSASGDQVVLDADEWRAIVLGAEADRLWSRDFAGLCARKRSDPSWRIDAEVALAGAQPDERERWSAARVLERVGAEVVAIELEAA